MSTSVELRAAFSPAADRGATLESIGISVLRYALVLIFVLFGALKFTAAEAAAIKPLVSNSPLMSWLYSLFTDEGVSRLIGTSELVTAVLLAVRPISARAAAIGGALAIGTFLTTVSFLFSTPGALSPMHPAHGFLLKDVVLLGAAVALAAESLRAATREAAAQ
jgi:reactive chlorine resistance protein C